MKHLHLFFLAVISILITGSSFCSREIDIACVQNNDKMEEERIRVTVNARTFTATLLDNNTAKAFKQMLPLNIKMIELNRNEKYADLPNNLPANPSTPKTITSGDLMLYGSATLVLFYKSFSTSYRYTKLGQIDDATGLAAALGSQDTMVTFELE